MSDPFEKGQAMPADQSILTQVEQYLAAHDREAQPHQAAFTSPSRIHKILVAVDHEKHTAVKTAATLARALDAELFFIWVLDPALTGSTTKFLYPDTYRSIPADAANALRDIRASLPPAITANILLREGDPASEIIHASEEFDADLIVIGTHHRGPLSRFFLGSVSQAVLRRADCPILLVNDFGPEDSVTSVNEAERVPVS